MKLRPLIKIHGGSGRYSSFIINHFPPNYENFYYNECCVGGGSVFLNKKPSIYNELINDINPRFVTLWETVKSDWKSLYADLSNIEYNEANFKLSLNNLFKEPVNTYIKYRFSRGGLGKDFAWSDRKRGGKPGDENAYWTSLEQLKSISDRLQNTAITSYNVLGMLKASFAHQTLFYIDPPFVPLSRKSGGYEYDMTYEQHVELMDIVEDYPCHVALLGYNNSLYNQRLTNWNRYTKDVVNNSGQNKKKQRRELCLWTNY